MDSDERRLQQLLDEFFKVNKIDEKMSVEDFWYLQAEQDCNDPPDPPTWYFNLISYLEDHGVNVDFK